MKEVKEKYLKEIYLNILKAIIIVLYFFILNQAYENISNEHLELGIEILTMIFLFISIFIFEKAYKKDDGNLAIQGIEILVLSTYTLTSRHITNKFNFEFKSYSLVASYIFAIYFILKCIIIYTKGRKEEAESLSDIREIVKKDEPIIKEATKKSSNKKVEEANKKQEEQANKESKSKKQSGTKKNNSKTKKQSEQKTDTKSRKRENVKTQSSKKEVKKND